MMKIKLNPTKDEIKSILSLYPVDTPTWKHVFSFLSSNLECIHSEEVTSDFISYFNNLNRSLYSLQNFIRQVIIYSKYSDDSEKNKRESLIELYHKEYNQEDVTKESNTQLKSILEDYIEGKIGNNIILPSPFIGPLPFIQPHKSELERMLKGNGGGFSFSTINCSPSFTPKNLIANVSVSYKDNYGEIDKLIFIIYSNESNSCYPSKDLLNVNVIYKNRYYGSKSNFNNDIKNFFFSTKTEEILLGYKKLSKLINNELSKLENPN